MNEKQTIHGIGALAGGHATVQATSSTRMNFAVHHMLAAARFCRRVGEIERKNQGSSLGDFFDEILAFSSACVFSSVASLEAYANELFVDRDKVFPGFSTELLDKLWETFEQKLLLEKFDFALLLLEVTPFDRGRKPYQDVKALVELRNALTHFKPEWEDQKLKHKRISELLKNRFQPSPFLPASETIFSRRWATHGCTEWAVKSCLAFSEDFEKRTQLSPKFSKFLSRLATA